MGKLTFCNIKHELNVNEMNSRKRQIKSVAIIVRLLMNENIIVHHLIEKAASFVEITQ